MFSNKPKVELSNTIELIPITDVLAKELLSCGYKLTKDNNNYYFKVQDNVTLLANTLNVVADQSSEIIDKTSEMKEKLSTIESEMNGYVNKIKDGLNNNSYNKELKQYLETTKKDITATASEIKGVKIAIDELIDAVGSKSNKFLQDSDMVIERSKEELQSLVEVKKQEIIDKFNTDEIKDKVKRYVAAVMDNRIDEELKIVQISLKDNLIQLSEEFNDKIFVIRNLISLIKAKVDVGGKIIRRVDEKQIILVREKLKELYYDYTKNLTDDKKKEKIIIQTNNVLRNVDLFLDDVGTLQVVSTAGQKALNEIRKLQWITEDIVEGETPKISEKQGIEKPAEEEKHVLKAVKTSKISSESAEITDNNENQENLSEDEDIQENSDDEDILEEEIEEEAQEIPQEDEEIIEETSEEELEDKEDIKELNPLSFE